MITQRISWLTVVGVCAVLFFSTGLVASGAADATGYQLDWWITTPSSRMQGNTYTLDGSSGQAAVGAQAGGAYTLTGGFWQPFADGYAMYLPTIKR